MWEISKMQRTPKGVYVELEKVDGDGWLRMYVPEDAADAYRFDQRYELTVEEA